MTKPTLAALAAVAMLLSAGRAVAHDAGTDFHHYLNLPAGTVSGSPGEPCGELDCAWDCSEHGWDHWGHRHYHAHADHHWKIHHWDHYHHDHHAEMGCGHRHDHRDAWKCSADHTCAHCDGRCEKPAAAAKEAPEGPAAPPAAPAAAAQGGVLKVEGQDDHMVAIERMIGQMKSRGAEAPAAGGK